MAAKWGDLAVVVIYMSPNISRTEYASFLDGLAACVRRLGACLLVVLGDFNTYSTAWSSHSTNGRERDVQDWAAALDLRLMNRGSTSTCVGWRGESIVDLTWTSPAASRRVSRWGVSTEETLSDYLYILMEVAIGGATGFTGGGLQTFNLDTMYREGKRMAHVDFFSRNPIDMNHSIMNKVTEKEINLTEISEDWLLAEQRSDPQILEIVNKLQNDEPAEDIANTCE